MILFPASLQCSSSRECPAASTLSLVLDSSHQSTVPVVQLIGASHILETILFHFIEGWGSSESKSPLIHFLLGPVRVFHQSHLVSMVSLVVSINHLLVLQPYGEPHEVLLCGVFLAMDGLVKSPFLLRPSLSDCGQKDKTGS